MLELEWHCVQQQNLGTSNKNSYRNVKEWSNSSTRCGKQWATMDEWCFLPRKKPSVSQAKKCFAFFILKIICVPLNFVNRWTTTRADLRQTRFKLPKQKCGAMKACKCQPSREKNKWISYGRILNQQSDALSSEALRRPSHNSSTATNHPHHVMTSTGTKSGNSQSTTQRTVFANNFIEHLLQWN